MKTDFLIERIDQEISRRKKYREKNSLDTIQELALSHLTQLLEKVKLVAQQDTPFDLKMFYIQNIVDDVLINIGTICPSNLKVSIEGVVNFFAVRKAQSIFLNTLNRILLDTKLDIKFNCDYTAFFETASPIVRTNKGILDQVAEISGSDLDASLKVMLKVALKEVLEHPQAGTIARVRLRRSNEMIYGSTLNSYHIAVLNLVYTYLLGGENKTVLEPVRQELSHWTNHSI